MKLLKLDKKYAVEFFQGQEFREIKNLKIFKSNFGHVILTEQGDYILTDDWGLKTFTRH